MRMSRLTLRSLAAILVLLSGAAPLRAQSCNAPKASSAGSKTSSAKRRVPGVSRGTISAALGSVAYDPAIIRKDRAQGVFAQSFLVFSGRMVSADRMKRGTELLHRYKDTFARIEKQFGVPGPVIVGFWGLETDFGANSGKSPILGALATLAYDCRRPDMFREQLLAALKIIDRGDLTPDQMVGAWAGELGQTQFLPTHYLEFGVDFDGDGRVDLRNSVPDVLASTAKLHPALWLASRRTLDRGGQRSRRAALAGGGSRHSASPLEMGRLGACSSATDDRFRPTARPLRCCCPWGATVPLSSPSPTSRPIRSGTSRWSMRPPPPITPRGWPARRPIIRAGAKSPLTACRRCAACRKC